MNKLRTHYLGQLSTDQIDQEITVMGWVKKHRDLGELIFIDVKDIKGLAQVVVYNDSNSFELAKSLKNEYVIEVTGLVRMRQDINENIKTGLIEIVASEVNIINKSEPTPIQVVDDIDASEDTRLAYRYLDLRRDEMQDKLITRHKITRSIRKYLDNQEFFDIETPILTKATPEGARDYLVPSRVNKGEFYALPQSPQIYKNLLMIGGFERYYQIVKCFRDEDLRADRQPEFTQVDMEMSFMTKEQIMDLTENMLKDVMREIKGLEFTDPFIKMTYKQAMDEYGCDKPDIRFDLKLNDVSNIFANSEFGVFKKAEYVKCLNVLDAADKYSRKEIDKLEELAKKHHAKGMAWLKFVDGEYTGPIKKFLSDEELNNLTAQVSVANNSLILFAADSYDVVSSSLTALRSELGRALDLYREDDYKFLWVIDWPMFEYDAELDRLFAMHHPFTYPQGGSFNLDTPMDTMADAYDVVLNGFELGGGSIRINNSELQQQMFKLLSLSDEEVEDKFKFLIDAYKYGAPYHGGIALGLDRLAMILTNSESIKEVIAFPKNNRARELMIDSPSPIELEQLEELAIKVEVNE